MTYTYTATTERGQGFTSGMKLVEGFVGIVKRSDGVEVWRGTLYVGGGASDKRAAQLQANREAPKWRAHLARTGRCYHDEKVEKRNFVKAYKSARKAIHGPLSEALSAGMTAAATNGDNAHCPHAPGTPLAGAWMAGWRAASDAGLSKPEGA